MKTLSVTATIEESLKNAMTYQEYKNLINLLLEEGKATGPVQKESLTEYSKMNQRRMKRWDKTLKITAETEQKIKTYKEKLIWLVISEGWCGDAAHSLPVMHKLADLNKNIELKIVLRDENESLMNHFLTNGGKSIPKLIMYKPEEKQVLANWGPRPNTATKMVEAYKLEHGALDAVFKEELQLWYNKDKGQSIIQDILSLL